MGHKLRTRLPAIELKLFLCAEIMTYLGGWLFVGQVKAGQKSQATSSLLIWLLILASRTRTRTSVAHAHSHSPRDSPELVLLSA